MEHQEELENSKYRNWVRGGLAFKYLKQGIEVFADDLVLQEHQRVIKETPGHDCNRCTVHSFRPKHKRTDTGTCPWGQIKCGCLDRKKKPCPNKVCDVIYDEILKSYGSLPQSPNWKNTDIQKWCSAPWEVAKCYIKSPGYLEKRTASDIDAAGLLHVFINNTSLHEHLSCNISGHNVFSKTLERRNTIFHSPTMELEENELNECIEDVIAILEDEKELKQRPDAKRSVEKLRQLQQRSFIISDNDEIEVCRNAMASIETRSQELKQMIQDEKDDIEKRKSEACRAVEDKAETVIEDAMKKHADQSDSRLKAVKETTKLIYEKVKKIETDNSGIKKRLIEIDSRVDKLDNIRNVHQTHLKYLQEKQALQCSLVKRYERDYIYSSISPLRTQYNDIKIDQVYIKPKMEKIIEPTATKGTRKVNIDQYEHIFHTDHLPNRKVYIIGDVGTGKTSFGKMMIYNWSRAVTYRKNAGQVTQDQVNKIEQADHDIKEMGKFDYLFTIPLQRMSGFSSDLKEMIQALYKDVMTNELLNRIFSEESERCLIIADGLDEWTPPKHAPSPQHVSYGIPVADGVKKATCLTLSRPGAKGIQNMKLTEYDQRIRLLGVHEASVNDFIKTYMTKMDSSDQLHDFRHKIQARNIKHLEKSPLILQQLIWMYCTNHDIGTSVGDIYSNIVNIMFAWYENKEEEDITYPCSSSLRELEEMQLPELLRRFPRCEENKKLLLTLGKLSFEALTEGTSSGTFGRSGLRRFGLLRSDIDILTASGLLVEHKHFDPTVEDTYLAFTHLSYIEFFAAIFVSSFPCEEKTLLDDLFVKKKSLIDNLQFANFLKIVCGLSPVLLKKLSDLISKGMVNDERMVKYRDGLSDFQVRAFEQSEAELVQSLVCECLSEIETDLQPRVSLCDVIIGYDFNMSLLPKFVSGSVISVYVDFDSVYDDAVVEIMEWIAQLPQLQFAVLDGVFSCEKCEHLASSLTQVVSLKHVALKNISCNSSDCVGHIIDLSAHDQLRTIYMEDCSCMLGSALNKFIESVHVFGSSYNKMAHTICGDLASSLSQSVSTKHLKLENISCNKNDCEGHAIDLSKHYQLQSVYLDYCPSILITSAKFTNRSLEQVHISETSDHLTAHDSLEHLASLLSQCVSLRNVTLKNVGCDQNSCEDHAIDLSNNDKLQNFHLEHSSFKFDSEINSRNLENVYISRNYRRKATHVMCEVLASALSNAVSLKHLFLKEVTCDRDNCESHTINLFNYNQLQTFHLEHSSCMVGSMLNLRSLENVYISRDSHSRTAHAVCENISKELTEAFSLKQLVLKELTCDLDDCNGHSIDLSKHDKLQSICLEECVCMLGSLVDTKSVQLDTKTVQNVYILRQSHIRTSVHLICTSVRQEETFEQFVLLGVQMCGSNTCDCQTTSQLQQSFQSTTAMEGRNFMLSKSRIIPEHLCITRLSDLRLLIWSSLKDSLKTLRIRNIKQYTKEQNYVVETCQQLQILTLSKTEIGTNALIILPTRMQKLYIIYLEDVTMSLQTWQSFIVSLLAIQRPVHVFTRRMSIGQEQTYEALNYVSQDNRTKYGLSSNTVLSIQDPFVRRYLKEQITKSYDFHFLNYPE